MRRGKSKLQFTLLSFLCLIVFLFSRQVTRDFVLSNDDFRDIGSGRLDNSTEKATDQPNLQLEFPDFVTSYAKSTDALLTGAGNGDNAKDRRANEPSWTQVEWWQAQKKKEDARRLEEEMEMEEEAFPEEYV